MALSVTVLKLDGVLFPGEETTRQNIETLAWASAQIHGHYIVDPTLIKLSASTAQRQIAGSTLPKLESGKIMYSSNAEILVCDMKLKPQESRALIFSCTLPTDSLPPSYRGIAIKYSHVFSLVLQKSASALAGPPTVLSVPFRLVNPTCGLRRNDFLLGCPNYKAIIQTKAFLPEDPTSAFELQSQHNGKPVKEKDTRKILKAVFEKFGKPVCIKVNKGIEHLAVFTVERTVYQLGEVVRGFIDFSKSTVACYFLSMKLETVEEVSAEFFAHFPGKPSSIATKLIAESEEVLHNTYSTNFEFHIPLNASPTFATEFVSVRWVLRFELAASAAHKNSERPATEILPSDHQMERMSWQVPIKVLVASYPTDLIEQQAKSSKNWNI